MINQLFRTKFESNLTAFIVFLFLNALLGLFLIVINSDSHVRPVSEQFFTFISIWLLLFCLVAGALSLLRYNKEKSSRLYAQLPITSLQVRIAYWSHVSLYLCISSLMLLAAMVYADKPVPEILLFTVLYFFHAGVLLAVISILTSNTMRLIPDEIRKRTVIYFFLATFITFLFLLAIGFIVAGYVHVAEGGIVDWSLLTVFVTLLCIGLVALDIYLFGKKDNYLG
jgi:MFS family permease